jgi:hypothetical protein
MNTVRFTSQAISRESTIHLDAPVDVVFPLFDAHNEGLWVEGWNPAVIYPGNGPCREHMVFRTEQKFPGEGECTWVKSYVNKERGEVSYTVYTGERLWIIDVRCREDNGRTNASVRYTYIGLCDQGNRRNTQALDIMYRQNLNDWEQAINDYLHGSFDSTVNKP